MKAQVYWVPAPWPGRLGIVPRPRGGDWLEEEIRAWREAGVEVVVSLLTSEEAEELDLKAEPDCVRAEGLEYLSLPIQDYGVPASIEVFTQLVQRLEQTVEAGRSVAVHCRQGIGRSSVLVAAVLVAAGAGPEVAFQRIEKARGRPVPDTPEQREWVARQASNLLAAHVS